MPAMRGSPSAGRTDNVPIRSDIPHRPTIDLAMRVTISRSFSEPVVTMWNTSCSAAIPPSAPMMRPRRYAAS